LRNTGTPSITSNIDALINDIKKKESNPSINKLEFSQKTFDALWNEYRNNIDSMTVKNALENCIFEVQPNQVSCFFPSIRIKDIFIQQKEFSTLIQERFVQEDIAIETTVEISRFPDFEELMRKRRTLTTKEKFELLERKNPLIRTLIETMKLKLDNG